MKVLYGVIKQVKYVVEIEWLGEKVRWCHDAAMSNDEVMFVFIFFCEEAEWIADTQNVHGVDCVVCHIFWMVFSRMCVC